jgi:integrase
MPRTKRTRDTRKDSLTLRKLPSGRWQCGVWDQALKRYRYTTHDTRPAAEAAGALILARFKLGQDNAAQAHLDAIWNSFATEAYGITASEAEAIAEAEGSEEAAAALGHRLRANWRTVVAMVRVVGLMRKAGATDFKATGFRAKVAGMFNRMRLPGTKAQDGRVAVSTKERMRGQVMALVNHALATGKLERSPLAKLTVTGDRQQADTTREVFTLDEVRRIVALHKVADPVWVHAALMLYAGLRDAEARAVTWADYEPNRRLLWIRKGKGGKLRSVPVQAELAAILATVSDAIGPTATTPVMPSTPIARPTPGRSLARYANFIALLKLADVEPRRGIDPITGMERSLCRHSCRHTFAAAMLAAGEDGDLLRIGMGHGDASLTALYASQTASYRAEIEREGWGRGALRFKVG